MRAWAHPKLALLVSAGCGVALLVGACAGGTRSSSGNIGADASSSSSGGGASSASSGGAATNGSSAGSGADAGIAGRSVPAPIYGVTLNDVSDVQAEIVSLAQLAHKPTTRVYFDVAQSAAAYVAPVQQLDGTAYILGELVDSADMPAVTTPAAAQARAQEYTAALGRSVDIWEVGNEVNGNWLDTDTQDTAGKIEAMYDVVSSQGGATALTFFYEGEPAEPNNCIVTDHGGNDMFSWMGKMFDLADPVAARPAETEKIRNGIGYVLVSWYPDGCPNEAPDWVAVFTRLSAIFPGAAVGFGELGTANPQGGSAFEQNEITTYYPLAKNLALPAAYVGGYFWWYYAEEMVPTSKTVLFGLLNSAIK